MKKLLLISLLFASCTTYKFNRIKTTDYKFCVWTVVDKFESDSGCIYYWNRGANYFTDDCNKYNVGDTIKHQEQLIIVKGRKVTF